jgi:hypothetical protein
MNKKILSVLLTAIIAGLFASAAFADADGYKPGIKIMLEVRTAQGELRAFQRPGDQPTYWSQDFPIIQGDKVTITPLITTGGAELDKVRIRLDSNLISDSITPPWRLDLDSKTLVPGYHQVEVWAQTKLKKKGEASVNLVFLIVPPSDALMQIIQSAPTAPSVSAMPAPASPENIEEGLACTVRSVDAEADKAITETSSVKIGHPILVFVATGGPGAKEFFYTLTRDGQITYTSPKLPLLTQILLEPKKADGGGLTPGEAIFTARAGDGQGHFGPPAWITLDIAAMEQGK